MGNGGDKMLRILSILKENGIHVGYKLIETDTMIINDLNIADTVDQVVCYGCINAKVKNGKLMRSTTASINKLPTVEFNTGRLLSTTLSIIKTVYDFNSNPHFKDTGNKEALIRDFKLSFGMNGTQGIPRFRIKYYVLIDGLGKVINVRPEQLLEVAKKNGINNGSIINDRNIALIKGSYEADFE